MIERLYTQNSIPNTPWYVAGHDHALTLGDPTTAAAQPCGPAAPCLCTCTKCSFLLLPHCHSSASMHQALCVLPVTLQCSDFSSAFSGGEASAQMEVDTMTLLSI